MTIKGQIQSRQDMYMTGMYKWRRRRGSLREGGRLIGDVRTAGIVIEDGDYFKGMIDIVKKESDVEATAR